MDGNFDRELHLGNNPPHGNQNNLNQRGGNLPLNVQPVRTMRDYLNPPRRTRQSCIMMPNQARAGIQAKPGMLQALPRFDGCESEYPYLHLKEFEEICNVMLDAHVNIEMTYLTFFPFSLKGEAKTWFN